MYPIHLIYALGVHYCPINILIYCYAMDIKALLEMMGRYGSCPSSYTFSPRLLSHSAMSCHKAFSFLCVRINNSRQQQQPEWETRRRQLRKINERKCSSNSTQSSSSSSSFTINQKQRGSAHDKSIPCTNSGRRFGNNNPPQPGEGGGIKIVEENPVPPPLLINRSSSPPSQPEVFEGGVEVESSSSTNNHQHHEGSEDTIVGSMSRCRGDSLSALATIRSLKNENLDLKNENVKLKEKVNELQSLYDGLFSLNGGQTAATAGIRKSSLGMRSTFLQAQVLQLRRQINLQWVAVDAGVDAIQEVKGSLYALQDILRSLCHDMGSDTSTTTISPPGERRQTKRNQQQQSGYPPSNVKLNSWQGIHNEIVRLLCRIEAAERKAGYASNYCIQVPSKAGCFVGCGLSLPRELRLRNLSIADDIGGPEEGVCSKESISPTLASQVNLGLLPSHVNIGAIAALGDSLYKSLEALAGLIKALQDGGGGLNVGGQEAEQARQLLRSKAGSLSHSFSELLTCVGALGMVIPVKGVNAQDAMALRVGELARGVNPSKESGNECLKSIVHMITDSQRATKAAMAVLEDEVMYWKRLASKRDDALLKLAVTLREIGRDYAMDVNGGCLKAVSLTAANVFSSSNYGLLRGGGAGREVAELLAALECSKDMLTDAQSTLENYSNTLDLQIDRAWFNFDSSYSACAMVVDTSKDEGGD